MEEGILRAVAIGSIVQVNHNDLQDGWECWNPRFLAVPLERNKCRTKCEASMKH